MSAAIPIATDFDGTIIPWLKATSAINRHNRQLFDLLVGAHQNRQWHGKTERLGGLEVHHHLKLGRKLHRKVARLLAAQNAIDIDTVRR